MAFCMFYQLYQGLENDIIDKQYECNTERDYTSESESGMADDGMGNKKIYQDIKREYEDGLHRIPTDKFWYYFVANNKPWVYNSGPTLIWKLPDVLLV
jgi:hypothetical protein